MTVKVIDKPQPATLEEFEKIAANPDPYCERMNKVHPLADVDDKKRPTDWDKRFESAGNNLRNSIIAFGVIGEAIFVDARTEQVIDGLNTLRLWLKINDAQGKNLPRPHITWVEFESEGIKREFQRLRQLGRRNLAKGQCAQLQEKVFQPLERTTVALSIESKRKNSGVSRTTQKRATKVRKQGANELELLVEANEISSAVAGTIIASGMSLDEQSELARRGGAVVKARAKAIKEIKAGEKAAIEAEQQKAALIAAGNTIGRVLGNLNPNVEAALAKARHERGIEPGQPRPAPELAPDAGEGEMATPVAPRDRSAPAGSLGIAEAAVEAAAAAMMEAMLAPHELQLGDELRGRYVAVARQALAAASVASARGHGPVATGPSWTDPHMEMMIWWKGKTLIERGVMLRPLDGVLEAAWEAASEGVRATFLQKHVPDLPQRIVETARSARGELTLANGVTLAIAEQAMRVKRKTRDSDVLTLCEMIDRRA